MSMARSTRSGMLVGPGIWRKCLPVCTVVMGVLPGLAESRRLRGGAVRIALFGGLVPRSANPVNALDAGLEGENRPPVNGLAHDPEKCAAVFRKDHAPN